MIELRPSRRADVPALSKRPEEGFGPLWEPVLGEGKHGAAQARWARGRRDNPRATPGGSHFPLGDRDLV